MGSLMNRYLETLVRALGYKRVFHLDFETYSECDIKDGVRAYATHRSTEITLAAYAYNDEEPELFDLSEEGQECWDHGQFEIARACEDPDVLLIAWNTSFEREILKHVWCIDTPAEKWLDAMVVAYSMSLPGDLASASKILQLDADHEKDAAGKKLIQKFCKPHPSQKITRRDWSTDPKDWQRFGEYCVRDVIAERKCLDRMGRFLPPAHEIRLWWLDQNINARGMPIDVDLIDAAQEVTDDLKAALKTECAVLTGLTNPNSRDQFLPWIQAEGYDDDSLTKDKVDLALRGDTVTDAGRRALALRSQFSKNSTAKYSKIAAQTVDYVLAYTTQFAGAGRTWRWAGRGAQFQNLPGPPKELEDPAAMAQAVDVIKRRDPDLLRDLYDQPVNVLAGAIRPTVRAPEGKILRVADYNAIENRVLGWLAQCDAILDVFRNGLDPYKDFGTRMYNKPYDEITKKERTNSKPAVLGAGYMLGGGMLKKDKKTGKTHKTGLWAYSEALGVNLSKEESNKAVAIFREAYPEVVAFWYALDDAFRSVIQNRDTVEQVPVGFSGQFLELGYIKPALYVELPSGRRLWYLRPRVEMCNMPWDDEDTGKPARRLGITYENLDQNTRQWRRVSTHPGKLAENVTQAVARDVLANGLEKAAEAGFTPILHVHDEVITVEDIGDETHSVDALERVLCDLPDWCQCLPMAAEGYENPFYMKD